MYLHLNRLHMLHIYVPVQNVVFIKLFIAKKMSIGRELVKQTMVYPNT